MVYVCFDVALKMLIVVYRAKIVPLL